MSIPEGIPFNPIPSNSLPPPEKRSWFYRMGKGLVNTGTSVAQTALHVLVVQKFDVTSTIQAKKVEIKNKVGIEILDILNSLTPKLLAGLQDSIKEKVPELLVMAALNEAKSWIEATLLNIFANLIRFADVKPGEDPMLSILNRLCMDGGESFSTLMEKMETLNDPNEKLKLFQSLAAHFLSIGLPNQDRDLIVPETLYRWGFRKFIWKKLHEYLPQFLMDITLKIQHTQKAGKRNEEAIRAHFGGNELVDLTQLGAKQIEKAATKVMVNQGKNLEDPAKLSRSEKLVYGLVKKLGDRQGAEQFYTLIKQIGNYAQPVLTHVFAHLLKNKERNDEHALTWILNQFATSIFHFADQNREKLKEAHDKFLVQKREIENFYALKGKAAKDPIVQELVAQAKKPLRDVFEPELERFIKKAGLDAKSLEEVIPLFNALIADKAKEILFEQYYEFYRDVILPLNVPRKTPPSLSNYKEGCKLLECIVKEMVPATIKSSLSDPNLELGKTFIETINAFLFEGHFSASRQFFEEPLKQFVQKESFSRLSGWITQLTTENLIRLLTLLAVNNPDKPAEGQIDFIQSALQHLLKIVVPEFKKLDIQESLQIWAKMPEGKDKDFARGILIKEFIPCAKKVLASLGAQLDNQMLVPASSKAQVHALLEKTVLPALLFDLSKDLLLPKEFSEDQKKRLALMGNLDRLDQVGAKLSETMLPSLKKSLSDFSYLIANKLNEKMASPKPTEQNPTPALSLNPHEEAILGHGLQQIIEKNSGEMDATWKFLQTFIGHAISRGFKCILLNYKGPNVGDAFANVVLHIRMRMAEFYFDKKLYTRIEEYVHKTRKIRKLEEELAVLRAAAVKHAPNYQPQDILERIQDKMRQVQLAQKIEYKEEYEELLNLFKPIAKTLLADMGYKEPKDLPVPTMVQKNTFESLRDFVLPDQCLRVYYDHLRFHRESQTFKDNLDARFNANPGEHCDLVKAAKSYADTALKFGDNWMIANATQLADLTVQGMGVPFEREGELPVGAKLEVGERVLGKEAPLKTEFFWSAARKEVKGAILDIMDGFTSNIERLENQDASKMFRLALRMVSSLTTHLKVINDVAQGRQMHELNPGEVVEAFERKRIKHPAMPSSENVRNMEWLEQKILEEKENLKRNPDSMHIQNKLRTLEKDKKDLQTLLSKEMDENFYNRFSEFFLSIAGKRGPQDLRVSPALQEILWKQLKTSICPNAFRNGFSTTCSPEMMNMTLMSLLTTINANLGKALNKERIPVAASPAEPVRLNLPEANPLDIHQCVEFIRELARALPNTWTQSLLNLPFVDTPQVTGQMLEKVLRESLGQWLILNLIQTSFVSGAKEFPPRPVTPEEVRVAKEKGAQENLKNKTNFTPMAESIFDQVRNLIIQFVSTTWLGWIAMVLFRIPFNFIWSILNDSVKRNGDPIRKNLAEFSPHANLLFHWGDHLQEILND